jgi:hypothetical protein
MAVQLLSDDWDSFTAATSHGSIPEVHERPFATVIARGGKARHKNNLPMFPGRTFDLLR